MIYYRPTDGGPAADPIKWRPRSAFVMQQLGRPVPPEVRKARSTVNRVFKNAGYATIDAGSQTTGADFLLKIWRLTVGCPVGIAIIQQGIPASTLANIFYELGLMQAYGRETAVIRIGRPDLPSDFVRTEYLAAGRRLEASLKSFLGDLTDRAETYELMAAQLENDPLLSIDFLRRAYLLTERAELRTRARAIFEQHGMVARSLGSVEQRLVDF